MLQISQQYHAQALEAEQAHRHVADWQRKASDGLGDASDGPGDARQCVAALEAGQMVYQTELADHLGADALLHECRPLHAQLLQAQEAAAVAAISVAAAAAGPAAAAAGPAAAAAGPAAAAGRMNNCHQLHVEPLPAQVAAAAAAAEVGANALIPGCQQYAEALWTWAAVTAAAAVVAPCIAVLVTPGAAAAAAAVAAA